MNRIGNIGLQLSFAVLPPRSKLVFKMILPILAVALLSILLSACNSNRQNASTLGSPASISTPNTAAGKDENSLTSLLPKNYRNRAAVGILPHYIKDADGPPEISEETTSRGLFRTISSAIFRYPVNIDAASRQSPFFRLSNGPIYRCGTIYATSDSDENEENRPKISVLKNYTTDCSSGSRFDYYKEVDELAEQCRRDHRSCDTAIYSPLGGQLIFQ